MEAAKKQDPVQAETGLPSPRLVDRYASFRRELLHRWNELVRHTGAERTGLEEQVLTSPGDVGDASVMDTSADYFLKLADNDRRELLEIHDAIARMHRGIYGMCESCELEIPVERLEKLPHARRCIDCQTLIESRSRVARMNAPSKL